MSKLIIQRTSEYTNRLRDYKIYIDGQKVDTISNGQTKDLNISPGRHTLFFKIDWCRSPEISFEIVDNEAKMFNVRGFKNSDWILPLALGIVILHYIVKILSGFDYLIYLAVPPFLVLIYYITVGRKKYLSLKEISGLRRVSGKGSRRG
jgi:hypothetical protein